MARWCGPRGPTLRRPRRAIRVLALGLLLLAPLYLAPAPLAAGAEAEGSAGLTTFSECADARTFPWIAPLLGRLDTELTAAATEMSEQDPDLSLGTWAARGSGFLRHVQRGRDLDCLALFDLGVVSRGDAPSEAIDRIETVLRTLEARRQQVPRNAALAPWKVRGLTPEGALRQREFARSLLGQAFAPDARQPLSVLLPHEAGGFAATKMAVGEAALPVRTSTHYLSNAIRYRSGMPAALREVSVQLFFAVTIREIDGSTRRFVLTPTDTETGRPDGFQENVFSAVFPHPNARDRFAGYLHPEYEFLCARNYLAGRLVRQARAHVVEGTRPQALEQMHQVLDLLAPVYDAYTRRRVNCDLARWLDTPSVRELSDLGRIAGLVAEARRDPALFALYVEAGTLDVINAWFGRACRGMTRQLPGQGSALRAVISNLSHLVESGDEATTEEWSALAMAATQLAEATGPHERSLRADLCCLEAPFLAAGWRFLPVVGATEDAVLLSAGHLATECVPPAALTSFRYGDFALRTATSSDGLRAASEGPESEARPAEPRSYLAVPIMRGHGEHRACACWRGRLARVDGCLRWRVGCARASKR